VSDFQRSLRGNSRLRTWLAISLLVSGVALAIFFGLRLHFD